MHVRTPDAIAETLDDLSRRAISQLTLRERISEERCTTRFALNHELLPIERRTEWCFATVQTGTIDASLIELRGALVDAGEDASNQFPPAIGKTVSIGCLADELTDELVEVIRELGRAIDVHCIVQLTERKRVAMPLLVPLRFREYEQYLESLGGFRVPQCPPPLPPRCGYFDRPRPFELHLRVTAICISSLNLSMSRRATGCSPAQKRRSLIHRIPSSSTASDVRTGGDQDEDD